MKERLYSLNTYCKETFSHPLYKIALDGGFGCPHRDGGTGKGGCIFCSAGGSGEHAERLTDDLDVQLQKGILAFRNSKQVKIQTLLSSSTPCFIAYFQAFTNTYGPTDKCRRLFTEALSHPLVKGISIATRPDCLDPQKVQLLSALKAAFPEKFIWVELGLQTMHEKTALRINRGYSLPVFEEAVSSLHNIGIPIIVHTILGLPGENTDMLLQTITYLNTLPIFGIKLQLLHILKGTVLAEEYEQGCKDIIPLSKEEYIRLLILCVRHLSPAITIHRLTGDGPKELLLAPTWSLHKRDVLNSIRHQMAMQHAYQGDLL